MGDVRDSTKTIVGLYHVFEYDSVLAKLDTIVVSLKNFAEIAIQGESRGSPHVEYARNVHRRNDQYPNIYNSSWKNQPNLSWGSHQNQQPQQQSYQHK